VSPMYSAGNARPGLILGLGAFTDSEIEMAARHLARCIDTAATGVTRNTAKRPKKKTTQGRSH
jgi:GntR family transcriptional regulator/MocR family aminotransferase